eukprot:TRINITY_DN5407_c0_g1_i2.p1 TRINITY_DN5407_c0_g1~~TRINITY_DN5407_c0_g1_i2.p1  ORF type:complete len:279 (+),score=39.76 TRINITY_DN5407_c0_g1_i2:15-851(+)
MRSIAQGVCLVLVVGLLVVVLCSCVNADSQYDALRDFYTATGGSNWANNTGWASNNNDPCGRNNSNKIWHGLQCSGGWVTQILLRKNGLGGVLPSSLANIPYLEVLDLSDNLLIGSIPKSLGDMQSLSRLRLINNHFSGAIPSFGSNSTSLTYLYLGSNQLQGGIPQSILQLTGLREFDLSDNHLTGPVLDGLAGLSLISLWINNNNFSGRLSLKLCQSLILCSGAFNIHLMCASMSCTCGAMQSCNCNTLCQTDSDCAGKLCTSCVGATPFLNGYCK